MSTYKLYLAAILFIAGSRASAAQFNCVGTAIDESGKSVPTKITLDIEDDSLTVTEENGTQFGFDMTASLDTDYRPSAKYAGYYRFKADSENSAGWKDILIQKPMLDNKRARGGGAVLQGTVEDGGSAAYFDSCSRIQDPDSN